MHQTCLQCSASFEITPKDIAFYREVDVSVPVDCPGCRSRLRCSHRNERSLSKRVCSLCTKGIVSMYPSDVPFPVYCSECFFSDRWNPLQFGQDYQEQVPFLEQLEEMLRSVPRLSIINKQTENSEYSNYSFANKNCYLTFGSHSEEDCLYSAYSTQNRTCVDCMFLYGSELLYECTFSKNCYRSLYLDRCEGSVDCAFSRDLNGCKDCLFCANLHRKQFCLFNEQLSEEDYRAAVAKYALDTESGQRVAKRIFTEELPARFPVRALMQTHCEECEGSTLHNCKNMRHCYFCSDSEECSYTVQNDNSFRSADMDYMGYDRSERCFQTIGCQGLYDCIACNACWHGSSLRYCQSCFSSHDCIGCISLQQKRQCILNREYEPEEYERIAGLIMESMKQSNLWGTFFPTSFTPFAYNETIAIDWFPLTEEEAMQHGYRWKRGEDLLDVAKIIQATDLPEHVDDIPDDVLNWAIRCEQTQRPFRITQQELYFYRTMHLPLPRLHPDERHRLRIARRHPRKLWDRECAKCRQPIMTTYDPNRPEIVYCEECYLKEVY